MNTPATHGVRGAEKRRIYSPLAALYFSTVFASAVTGCNRGPEPALTQLAESRRLAADLHLVFNKGADAANRAVMADTDEASITFAREAEQANDAVQKNAQALSPLLRDYPEERRLLDEFNRQFAEYQKLDRRILELAVENTNLKAQQLAFGPARETADNFQNALDALTQKATAKNKCLLESQVARAVVAVRKIQVLHAPHIAEPGDAAMTRMEKEMADLEASARGMLDALSSVDPSSHAEVTAARVALDRFKSVHAQIVGLSRRNTNVQSLSLSLGPKRTLIIACDAPLTALEKELAKEGSKATR